MATKILYLVKNEKFANYEELMKLEPMEVVSWKNSYSDFDDYVGEQFERNGNVLEDREAMAEIYTMNALQTIRDYNEALKGRFSYAQKELDEFKAIPFLGRSLQDVLDYKEYLDTYKGYIAEEKVEEDTQRDFINLLVEGLREFNEQTQIARDEMVLVLKISY